MKVKNLFHDKDGRLFMSVAESAKELWSSGALPLYTIFDDGESAVIAGDSELLKCFENGWPICILISEHGESITKEYYELGRASFIKDTQEFSNTFGLKVSPTFSFDKALMYKQHSLIMEEVEELEDAITASDQTEVLDAVVDIMYLCYNTLNASGLHSVFLEAWDEVHRSNMSKLGEDGKPIYREDGKVIKGPNFFRPNIAGIVYEEFLKQQGGLKNSQE